MQKLIQPRVLLVAAAIFHILIAATVFTVGRLQLLPAHVLPNGIGKSFAIDTLDYEAQCVELARIIKTEGLVAWARWPTQLHLRFYSLPFALVSRWTNFNILTIEPLNLLYYLAILVLVFKIGERVFDSRGALIAAGIVAIWPSLLLHTTQLLRDPLLIAAVLLFIWTLVELLQEQLRPGRALWLGATSIIAMILIRIVRQPFWYLILATAGAAIFLFALGAWRKRRISKRAIAVVLLVAAVLLAAVFIVTPRLQPYFNNQQELRAPRVLTHDELERMPLVAQIAATRRGFNSYYDPDGNVAPARDGSLIDPDLRVRTLGDVIRLVPRAIEVGFLAPFPNMWFATGRQVGSSGRWLAAIETLFSYMIECLALFGLWKGRHKLTAWLLGFFVALGAVSLGLAVNNVGALYRLRYPFWIVLVIIGAGGISMLVDVWRRSKSPVLK